MDEITVTPTVPADADELYLHLRAADMAECEAYGRGDVLSGIRESVRGSLRCWTVRREGVLLGVFGVAPLSFITGVGSPWMLGTPALDRHPRLVQRLVRQYLPQMLEAFPHLINFVHAQNTRSIRWLTRLGFTLHAPQPYGLRGDLFHRFEMRAHV